MTKNTVIDIDIHGKRRSSNKLLLPALFIFFLAASFLLFNSGPNKVLADVTCGLNNGTVDDYAGAVIYVRYHVSGSPTYYEADGITVTVTDISMLDGRDNIIVVPGASLANLTTTPVRRATITVPQVQHNCTDPNNSTYADTYPHPVVFAYDSGSDARGGYASVDPASGNGYVLDCETLETGTINQFSITGNGVPTGATAGGTWDSTTIGPANGSSAYALLTYTEPPPKVNITISGLVATQAVSGGSSTPVSGLEVAVSDQTTGNFIDTITTSSGGTNYSMQVPQGDLYEVYMVSAPPGGYTGPSTNPNGQLSAPWYACTSSTYTDQIAESSPSTDSSSCPSLNSNSDYNFLYTGSTTTTQSLCTGVSVAYSGSGNTYNATASYTLGTSDSYSTSSFSWGDGSGTTGNNGSGVVTSSHAYSSSGTYPVSVTISFTSGGQSTCSTSVSVSISPPPASACNYLTASGTSPTFSVSAYYTLASLDSYSNSTFNWGDGNTTVGGTNGSGVVTSVAHTYSSTGTYTVIATITFTSGTTSSCSTSITVTGVQSSPSSCTNLALAGVSPSFHVLAYYTLGGGATYDTSSFSWGDGTAPITGGTNYSSFIESAPHTYTTPGTYTAIATLYFFTSTGAVSSSSCSTSVTVLNNIVPSCDDGTYNITAIVSPSSEYIGYNLPAMLSFSATGPFSPSSQIIISAVSQLGITSTRTIPYSSFGTPISLLTSTPGTYSVPISVMIVSTVPGTPSSTSTCPSLPIRVAYQPYTKVNGGDVVAGSTFNPNLSSSTCTALPAATKPSIIGWNLPTSFAGAGTEFAGLALGAIDGFATTQSLPGAGTGLSFSNDPTSTNNINLANTQYGGYFGQVSCTPDYYDTSTGKLTSGSVLSGSVAINSSFNGAYSASSLNITGGTLSPGQHLAIYVDDGTNVEISGNISLGGPWTSVSQIPSFELIVKGGNINVEGTVTSLDGLYVSQGGTIYDCSIGGVPANGSQFSDSCYQQLTVNGSFTATTVDLMRTISPRDSLSSSNTLSASTQSAQNASEVFNYNPALWLGLSDSGFGNPAAGTSGTTYNSITSLPPVL